MALLIIVGKSGVGKNAVTDRLQRDYGYTRILTFTDRPIRPKEHDGVDYHFVSPEVFTDMMNNNEFFETTEYTVADSNRPWRYGTLKNIFENNNSKSVIILNPKGIEVIQREIPKDKYCVCYLAADDKTIRSRLLHRGDNPNEAKRRILADNVDFENLKSDITIFNSWNDDLDKVTRDVAQFFDFWRCGKE